MKPEHFLEFGKSIIASIFSVSNILFWAQTGYFDTASQFKPLLHTWSLGVEEQFYLIWPILILIAFKCATPVWVIIAIASCSFFAACLYVDNTAATFFLMPFRIFEFCLGALILWVPKLTGQKIYYGKWIAVLGCIAIIFSIFSFSTEIPFPYYNSLIPCIGTAALIYAERAGPAILLTNPVLVYIGKISYSLYLIHWPLLMLYQYWHFYPMSALEHLMLILICFLLAAASWRYVEQPFRLSERCQISGKVFLLCLIIAVILLTVTGLIVTKGKTQQSITDHPDNNDYPLCSNGYGICYGPENVKDMVLIGDSHSGFTYFFNTLAINSKQTISAYHTLPACFPLFDNGYVCAEEMNRRLNEILDKKPTAVILAGNWNTFTHAYESNWLLQKIQTTIRIFNEKSIQVYFWGSMPFHDQDASICYEGRFKTNCSSRMKPDNFEQQKIFNQELKEIVQSNRAKYFDLFDVMCAEKDCDIGANGKTLYSNQYHIHDRFFTKYLLAKKHGNLLTFEHMFH